MGFSAAAVGAVSSIASLGLKAGGQVTQGVATQQQDYTASQNYLLTAQATAENALVQSKTTAASYRYQGAEEEAQFGLQAGQLEEQASAETAAAQAGKLQSALVDVNARQTLTQQLGNTVVTRAAGGANPTSPTTAALLGYDYNVSEVSRTAQEATLGTQVAQEQAASAYESASANFAMVQGANAEDVANANARAATAFGTYNADVATYYGTYNAAQAQEAGNLGFLTGVFGAGSSVLGGLGQAFSSIGKTSAPTSAPATS